METSPPPLTQETREKLEENRGFQALVSYTDQGFEPTTIAIQRGDTVRFTNNSSNDLWVAVAEDENYPSGTQDSCSSSDLDSCAPIAPMDFWQFTFERTGEWSVMNNLDKEKRLTVQVK